MRDSVLVILFLSAFALVPAALLALIRPAGRWAFFLLGLVVAFGSGLVVNVRGADNSNGVLEIIGLGVAAGAVLVEAIAFPLRRRRRRREAAAGDVD